jgi:hypothetical protein
MLTWNETEDGIGAQFRQQAEALPEDELRAMLVNLRTLRQYAPPALAASRARDMVAAILAEREPAAPVEPPAPAPTEDHQPDAFPSEEDNAPVNGEASSITESETPEAFSAPEFLVAPEWPPADPPVADESPAPSSLAKRLWQALRVFRPHEPE